MAHSDYLNEIVVSADVLTQFLLVCSNLSHVTCHDLEFGVDLRNLTTNKSQLALVFNLVLPKLLAQNFDIVLNEGGGELIFGINTILNHLEVRGELRDVALPIPGYLLALIEVSGHLFFEEQEVCFSKLFVL